MGAVFLTKIEPHHESLVQIFFKDFLQFYNLKKQIKIQFLQNVAAMLLYVFLK